MKNQNALQIDPGSSLDVPTTDAAVLDRTAATHPRPRVQGKFIVVGEEKLWVKGVTYGTFRPDDTGLQYPQAGTGCQGFRTDGCQWDQRHPDLYRAATLAAG